MKAASILIEVAATKWKHKFVKTYIVEMQTRNDKW